MEKVNELVAHEVAKVLGRLLPDFLVTITEVEVSKDLAYAKIWISSLKSDEITRKSCSECSHEIQSHLAKTLDMRKTPKVRFLIDKRERQAQKIEELIREIH